MEKLSASAPDTLSSLSLAFVGDSVYDLLVRRYLVGVSAARVGALNAEKVAMVCCSAQSRAAAKISGLLTEHESAVYRRGRNAAVHSVPKNSSVADYHSATGLEALFGYLYLSGDNDRINELFAVIVSDSQ